VRSSVNNNNDLEAVTDRKQHDDVRCAENDDEFIRDEDNHSLFEIPIDEPFDREEPLRLSFEKKLSV